MVSATEDKLLQIIRSIGLGIGMGRGVCRGRGTGQR